MDKVYYFYEYNRTIDYGNPKVNIKGVAGVLRALEQEKDVYFQKVTDIANAERSVEETRYNQYAEWRRRGKNLGFLEIFLIVAYIVRLTVVKYLFPISLRTSVLFSLGDVLLTLLVFFIGPIAFAIAEAARCGYGIRYNQYIKSVSAKIHSLGMDFEERARTYYKQIDNLYLQSLDPTQRELILLRREQEAHNKKMLQMEQERKNIEQQHLWEQQRARQATEELLVIEKERERRRKERERGW